MRFDPVEEFENKIAEFYGSLYAVAVDCCTHGIELCLRYVNANSMLVPTHTYISIPFIAKKIGIELEWKEENWVDYYYVTENIIDAAVLWKKNSYIPGTHMCISFQYRKHLSLGRGGAILTDNKEAATQLKKMSHDGRLPNVPWGEQNVNSVGYHYYMTPETAQLGLEKLHHAIDTAPKQWKISDWPNLRNMDIFKNEK